MRDAIGNAFALSIFGAWKLLLAVFMYAEEEGRLAWRECWRRAAERPPKGGW